MSRCWTLCVLMLCARPADLRQRDRDQDQDRPLDLPTGGLEGLEAGVEPLHRDLSLFLPREQPRGPGLRSGLMLSAPRGARGLGPEAPEGAGLNTRPRARLSRGTKGSWRRRVHVTSGPDRYFTTPHTEPPRTETPRMNVSADAPLPLGEGALWGYALLLLVLVLFSVGLVGNLALLCLVRHSARLQSAWHCVLAGLALWDFLVLFFCLPALLLHQLTGTRIMGALSCSLVPFLQVSSMGVATFSLCALSIDCFHSATSPALLSAPVESCTSIMAKLSVVFVGALLLASPELLLHRRATLPPQDGRSHYSAQLDVCLAEPSPELPLAVLPLVLTYQEARPWWVFGCYLCLPLLFTLSCDLVTRRVTSQRAPQPIGRQEGGSLSSSPAAVKKDIGSNRSPSPSVSRQEVCSRTSSLNRKLQEAGQRPVILALIGLYAACTLPDAACSIAMSYLPPPVGVAAVLHLIGQLLLFTRCSATPLLALRFSKPLGGTFVNCCCCCCDECHSSDSPGTPTASVATPSTLLATPLSAVAPPLGGNTPLEQQVALGTPC